MMWRVVLPLSAASIYDGIQVAVVVAVLVAVVSEMVSGGSGLGQLMIRSYRFGDVRTAFATLLTISLIGYAVWAVVVTIVGTKLMPEPTTKADFAETFRTIAFAASPGVFNVLAIIPFLGPLLSFLISLWSLVIMVIAIRVALDYSNTGRAIIVAIIGFIVYWIAVAVIMTPILLGSLVFG